MKFIKTKRKDLEPIMKIIGEAQVFLASHNIDQWQNGYPNEEAILRDITNNVSYIITSKDSILGCNGGVTRHKRLKIIKLKD